MDQGLMIGKNQDLG